MKKIIFCFQQVGGANALLPLIENWKTRYSILITGRKLVCENLRKRGFEVSDYGELSEGERKNSHNSEWFEKLSPDIVITDTIALTRTPDGIFSRNLWALAKKCNTPCVAYVDSWWAYKQRFCLSGEDLVTNLPDIVAVIDSIAEKEMMQLGFPVDKIRILGSPLYEKLTDKAEEVHQSTNRRSRESLEISMDSFLLVFVSQPFKNNFGTFKEWGFTEKTVFRDVMECLATLSLDFRRKLSMLVLLHPEEDGRILSDIAQKFNHGIQTVFCKGGEVHNYILAADLVVGMFSILLSEAVILKRPVISIQPDLKREDMLITNLVGATVPVRTHEQFYSHFLRAVTDSNYQNTLLDVQKKFHVVADSSKRWKTEIERLFCLKE